MNIEVSHFFKQFLSHPGVRFWTSGFFYLLLLRFLPLFTLAQPPKSVLWNYWCNSLTYSERDTPRAFQPYSTAIGSSKYWSTSNVSAWSVIYWERVDIVLRRRHSSGYCQLRRGKLKLTLDLDTSIHNALHCCRDCEWTLVRSKQFWMVVSSMSQHHRGLKRVIARQRLCKSLFRVRIILHHQLHSRGTLTTWSRKRLRNGP